MQENFAGLERDRSRKNPKSKQDHGGWLVAGPLSSQMPGFSRHLRPQQGNKFAGLNVSGLSWDGRERKMVGKSPGFLKKKIAGIRSPRLSDLLKAWPGTRLLELENSPVFSRRRSQQQGKKNFRRDLDVS